MNNYNGINLTVDCLQNVFFFLDRKDIFALSSLSRKFNSTDNDFWKSTCPHLISQAPKIEFNETLTVRNYFIQKQCNEEVVEELRFFLNTVSQGTIEFKVREKSFIVFKINDPSDKNPAIHKNICVKQAYAKGLNIRPIDKAYKYPPEGTPFFVSTSQELADITALSVPFKKFLENLHKKIGCECKEGGNCELFIESAKKEMQLYFKDRVSAENHSAIVKRIENITINTFTSEDKMKIIAEILPRHLKLSLDRYLDFNRKVKNNIVFKLTCSNNVSIRKTSI